MIEKRRLQDEAGFTLVEWVLVIAVLAVIGGMVITIGVDSMASSKLNSAVRKLSSDIRFAQQVTTTKRILHGVVFNFPAAQNYRVFEQDDPTNPARDPAGGNDFDVDFTLGVFQGVTISTTLALDGAGRRLVKFNPKGEPLGGDGNAVSAGSNTVTLSYAGVPSKTITIELVTGKLTIS